MKGDLLTHTYTRTHTISAGSQTSCSKLLGFINVKQMKRVFKLGRGNDLDTQVMDF